MKILLSVVSSWHLGLVIAILIVAVLVSLLFGICKVMKFGYEVKEEQVYKLIRPKPVSREWKDMHILLFAPFSPSHPIYTSLPCGLLVLAITAVVIIAFVIYKSAKRRPVIEAQDVSFKNRKEMPAYSVVSEINKPLPLAKVVKSHFNFNEDPYFLRLPMGGIGGCAYEIYSNGRIGGKPLNPGKFSYNPGEGLSLFYLVTGGEGLCELNQGVFWMRYPQGGFQYETDVTPLKLATRFFSPVIPHNYQETSYPVSIFELSAENPTGLEQAITWVMPLVNFTRLVDWNPEDVNICFKEEDGIKAVVLENRQWESKGIKGQIAVAIPSEFSCGLLDNFNNSSLPGFQITFSVNPYGTQKASLALAMDFPEIGTKKHLRRYTDFAESDGRQAFNLAKEAIQKAEEWRRQIDKWQGLIVNDLFISDEAKAALFQEMAYLTKGGTRWYSFKDTWAPGWFAYLESRDYTFYNTSDVFFYAGWMLLRFWPELFKNVVKQFAQSVGYEDLSKVEYGNNFMSNDLVSKIGPKTVKGQAPHDMGGGFSKDEELGFGGLDYVNTYVWRNINDWKDLNSKFVLMIYAGYQQTGCIDSQFIDAVWPAVKEALQHGRARMQKKGSVLPVHSGFPDQTFDNITMTGYSGYTAILWLTALEAGIQIAGRQNDSQAVKDFQVWFNEGERALEELWNEKGGYYFFDPKQPDLILADILSGAWYAKLLGLKLFISGSRIRRTLRAIYSHNFKKEGRSRGAVNIASSTRENIYSNDEDQKAEVWTGVNYALAHFMRVMGMKKQGNEILQAIQKSLKNYSLLGRTPESFDPRDGFEGMFRVADYMRPGVIAVNFSESQSFFNRTYPIKVLVEIDKLVVKFSKDNRDARLKLITDAGALSKANLCAEELIQNVESILGSMLIHAPPKKRMEITLTGKKGIPLFSFQNDASTLRVTIHWIFIEPNIKNIYFDHNRIHEVAELDNLNLGPEQAHQVALKANESYYSEQCKFDCLEPLRLFLEESDNNPRSSSYTRSLLVVPLTAMHLVPM